MQTTGQRIRILRMLKGLSQEDLAQAAFVSRQTVSRWENDDILPDMESAIALCKIFGVTMDSIISVDGVETVAPADDKKDDNVGQSRPDRMEIIIKKQSNKWLLGIILSAIFPSIDIMLLLALGIINLLPISFSGLKWGTFADWVALVVFILVSALSLAALITLIVYKVVTNKKQKK